MNTPQCEWSVGSARTCDLVVDHPSVAARHAEFKRVEEQWIAIPHSGCLWIQNSDRRDVDAAKGDWTQKSAQVKTNDTVWLSETIRCPWPLPMAVTSTDRMPDITIGRASDCDIVINRSSVSSRHANLRVDRFGQVVLLDNQSRNGVFIDADLRQRVNAVLLNEDMLVYLGSHVVAANDLMQATKRIIGERAATTTRKKWTVAATIPVDKSPQSVTKAFFWGGMLTVPSLLIVLFALNVWKRSASETRVGNLRESLPVRIDVVSSHQPSGSMAVPEAQAPLAAELSAGYPNPSVDLAPTPSAIPPAESAIYWIAITHDVTGAVFRVGTATAIDKTKLITAGSVIASLEELAKNGFSNPIVINIITAERFSVLQRGISFEYRNRAAKAMALIEQHEKMIARAEQDGQAMEELRQAYERGSRQIQLALATLRAVDVGWLVTNELPFRLSLDTQASFHPQLKLTAFHAALDAVDAMWRDTVPREIHHQDFRVLQQSIEVDEIAGILKLSEPWSDSTSKLSSHNSYNWAGVPLIADGKLIAMLVAPETGSADGEPSTEYAEWSAIAASTLYRISLHDENADIVITSNP